MAMNSTGMGDAVYNYLSANDPNFNKLSGAEQSSLKSKLEGIYGSATNYIQGNAEADPGATLLASAPTIVAPAGGGPCSGTGTITGKASIS